MSEHTQVLACPGGTVFGEVAAGSRGKLVVRCRDRRCRDDDGAAIYHTFDLATRLVTETVRVPRPQVDGHKR